MMSSEEPAARCFLGPKRKKILRKFAETTSAHGFALISKSKNPFQRIAWIVIVLIFWLVCVMQIYIAISKYMQSPTKTSVRIRHFTSLQFPAVTICNLNPIKVSWYVANMKPEDETKSAMANYKEARRRNMTSAEWSKEYAKRKSAAHLSEETQTIYQHVRSIYDKKINLTQAGFSIEEMLRECSFQSTNCSAANFTRWEHGTYGNCYTMIVTEEHYSFIGAFHGLSLTLYTADKEYLAKNFQGAGFQIEVHPPEYTPFPEDKGFTISPGVQTSVGVKLQQISRMPWPYDGTDCGDYSDSKATGKGLKPSADESIYYERYAKLLRKAGYPKNVNYTHQACIKSCYEKRLIKDCNCVEASFVTRADVDTAFPNNTIQACDVRSAGSRCFQQSLMKTSASGVCDMACPQSCQEQEYLTEKAFALWPRESYYESAIGTWNHSASRNTSQSASEARTNLLRLQVYFKELNYESVTESAAIDIWDLLSDIGGTLGLYVGISFLTFGEVLELLFACIAIPARQHLRQRAASKQTL